MTKGSEEPTQEDVAAIEEYEAAKKNGKLTLGVFERFDKRDLALDQTSGFC